MKNKKGITIVSLVVTITILLLLSTVTINVTLDTYRMANVQSYIAKMRVIQGKVDNISGETSDVSGYGFQKLSDLQATDQETYQEFLDKITNPTKYHIDVNTSWNASLDTDVNNYYYFDEKDLEKIGLKNQDVVIVINFATRNVISKKGVEYKGKSYYRQYDLQGGDQLH